VLGILVVVDENAVSLFLPPCARRELWRPALDVACECQRGPTHLVERPTRLDAHVDVEAALAGRLRPAPKPELVERLPDDASDLPYLRPPDARRRIEIDAQLVRMLEVLGTHGMRMKLEAREIREPDERSRIARHDLFSRSPGREAKLDDVDPVGTLLRGTLLIEERALDADRVAYEHVRASPCGVQRAVGDGHVVA